MSNLVKKTALDIAGLIIFITVSVAFTYDLRPEFVTSWISIEVLYQMLGYTFLIATVAAIWVGGYYWVVILLFMTAVATLTAEIPTLPKYGMWPKEQIKEWVLLCAVILCLFTLSLNQKMKRIFE